MSPTGPLMWFPWMWIFPLIFLVVMLTFLFRVFRGDGMPFCAGKETSEKKEDDTLDNLNQRYSRGEISRKEYERIKNSLELLQQRYSSGEISKNEYEKLKQDTEYRRNSSF